MAGISVDTLFTMHMARIAPGDDAGFLRLLTEADMRLLEWGRWRWTRGRVSLTPSDSIITLPINYVSILGARVDAYPTDINGEEHEFAPGGPGQLDVGASHGLRLIDQGLDDTGARYYKALGKSDDDWTCYALCHLAPFALYKTVDLPSEATAIDSDVTRCPSSAALKLAMLAILFEEANDAGNARSYMSDALRLLDNHEKAARGNARQTPNVRHGGLGLSGISNFR